MTKSKTNTLHIETNVILTKAMLSSLSCRGAERATCWRRRLHRKTDIMCVLPVLPRKGCQLSECGEEIESQQHNRERETMSFPLAVNGIMAISHSNFVVTTRKRILNLKNETRRVQNQITINGRRPRNSLEYIMCSIPA